MNLVTEAKKIRGIIEKEGELFFSRKRAHAIRNEVIKTKGRKVIGAKEKKMIKSYAKKTFGSSSFWPWLALYTEIRGEFKPGWIPDDFYTVIILDKLNPSNARICDYKTFDYRLFADFSVQPLLTKISGNHFDQDGNKIEFQVADSSLRKYNGEIVIKEDEGLGGSKVKFFESRQFDLNTLSPDKNYIIQPVLEQHEQLSRLNPNSVNTIRVVTYMNNEGCIKVKFAYLRFGIGKARVDNNSAGGGMCRIDDYGRLDKMAYTKTGMDIKDNHPETGVLFEEIIIPGYDKILEACIRSHEKFRYLKIIGWDVAVDSSGNPKLLEWNAAPNIWKAESLYGPFWQDEIQSMTC